MRRNDLAPSTIEDMNWNTYEAEFNANDFFYAPDAFTVGNLTVAHIGRGYDYPVSGDHIARERARA